MQGKAFCGHCGSPLVGESGKSKTGAIHNYYACAKKKKHHTCDKKNERKQPLEFYIVERTVNYMLTPERIEIIADALVQKYAEDFNASGAANLEKTINRLEKEISDAVDNLLAFTGNKLVLEFGELRESYKFKVKKEGGSISLSNTNGDGSFDLMTELNVCEDGSLLAYPMILDADVPPYRFVREEDKEKEMKIQDLSEDLPKEIQSKELSYFCLNFDHDGGYNLEESWPKGDYHWVIEKMEDGSYDLRFQVYQDSYMAINYHEQVSEEYVLGLAALLEKRGVIEHNGYHMKNNESTREYCLDVWYESGENIHIQAEGVAVQSCIFDLPALLEYAATLDLYYEKTE